MNDRDVIELERRLSSSLQAAAPRPTPEVTERLLSRVREVDQRRGFLGFSLTPMLAAVAVVVLAVAAGIGFGYFLPRDANIGTPSTGPSASATPTIDPTTSPTATPTPTGSPSDGPTAGWSECENTELGFGVRYPDDWWVQEEARPDPGLDPLPGCTYFAPEPVEVPQNAGLPPSIAIVFGVAEEPLGPVDPPYVVISSETTTVDGRSAVITESEATEDAAPFAQPGELSYGYRISLPNGEELVAGVSSAFGDYEREKEVLDLMMDTLEVIDG